MAPLLALCVAFLIVQTAPVGDRLQAMITALKPSFNQGLVHLSSVFDSVMNYDETVGNDHKDNEATVSIRKAIQSASNSLSQTEAIIVDHVQMYEAHMLFLTSDISAQQAQLRQGNTVLKQLTNEGTKWELESNTLRRLITHLERRERAADQEAEVIRGRNPKNTFENLWLPAMAVFYAFEIFGKPNPFREWEYINRTWQLETKKRLHFPQEAKIKLEPIADRQRAIEESVGDTRKSLEPVQTKLEQLQKEYSVFAHLGDQIRKISTFLVSLNGEIGVVQRFHQLMVLFGSLLKSVDSLVSFLEDNVNMVVLLGESEAVSKIHQHFSQNVVLTLGK